MSFINCPFLLVQFYLSFENAKFYLPTFFKIVKKKCRGSNLGSKKKKKKKRKRKKRKKRKRRKRIKWWKNCFAKDGEKIVWLSNEKTGKGIGVAITKKMYKFVFAEKSVKDVPFIKKNKNDETHTVIVY